MEKIPASKYLFTSQRLGFRTWTNADLDPMAAISADPDVMEFFPGIQAKDYVAEFIEKMNSEFCERAYCYFATEIIETGDFIGFIGLHLQTFESDFTPCTDIGWRLKKQVWNNGYATEGALRCLDYAFKELHLKEVYSITPAINFKSERIMQKAGMHKVKDFKFILLQNDPGLEDCVLYRKTTAF